MEPNFEKAFDKFLDCKEYDDVESCLFNLVRQAFRAGWLAAGGNPPQAYQNLSSVVQDKTDLNFLPATKIHASD